ncbi:type II toxin-antitoxin system YafQ family toxin [Pseudomonas sp. COR58]|uniref:Type II toxin-antitoxin system YafQ family toxin n=1 Tax=Pseudomonas ekonensis TaxID=2842353 RepID=A0ABS6PK45_9PSED|nr:type II toxin-antitoxin system YafQ family toxin [Pseudomonas ekonensis]MBV4460846.1 type II toxin-antitoxin system YafQ family toxin [Pseudomonas ekonensis]
MAKPEKKKKRAERPRQVAQTSEFKKSWDRYERAGRRDMNEVRKVMGMLFMGESLPPEYVDHALNGEWIGFRESHIGGDFLMIYENTRPDLITFVDLGTHSELFK